MDLREQVEKAVDIALGEYQESPTKEHAKQLSDFLVFLERVDNAPKEGQIKMLEDQMVEIQKRMQHVENALNLKKITSTHAPITRLA